ncbi:hypothetical protein ACWGDT_15620 [Streptomyces avermitilis]
MPAGLGEQAAGLLLALPFADKDEEKDTDFDTRAGCAKQYPALGDQWRKQGRRTILAGDLNVNDRGVMSNWALNPLSKGRYVEGDTRHWATVPDWPRPTQKLDYIFFSKGN